MTDKLHVLDDTLIRLEKGEPVTLATVQGAWSMAPNGAGTMMAISRDGAAIGSIFPGVDDQVRDAAINLRTGMTSSELNLVVDDGQACAAGFACGGSLQIRLATLGAESGELYRAVVRAAHARRSVVLCTGLSSGTQSVIDIDQAVADPHGGTEIEQEALRRAKADSTGVSELGGEKVLVQIFNAPLRLVIIGGVNIAHALVPAARLIGFQVTVVDPRAVMMSPARFDGATLVIDEPSTAVRAAALDSRSAVVTLSHRPEIDDPALIEALQSRAFYVGSLGSRRTHAARIERLRAQGLTDAQLARVHGPAGLSIGAVGAAEIAASIVAQLIAVLRTDPK